MNRWVRLRIEMDPKGKAMGRIGDYVFDTRTYDSRKPNGDQAVSAGIGIYGYNHPAPHAVAYFDDLTVDYLDQ